MQVAHLRQEDIVECCTQLQDFKELVVSGRSALYLGGGAPGAATEAGAALSKDFRKIITL